MANFQLNGRNIHGSTVAAPAGTMLAVELWGPLYESVQGSRNFDQELEVTAEVGGVRLPVIKGSLSRDSKVRKYQVRCPQAGAVTVFAKDTRFKGTWTQFTLDVPAAAAAGRKRYTKQQLTNAAGAMGWPGWQGASPQVQALSTQLQVASGGVLARDTSLQGAGNGASFAEHYAGLALDIMLDSAKAHAKRRAHNLILFFVANRAAIGFRHMYYMNFGFGATGTIAPEPKHHDHIHIDWFDGVLAEPAGYQNRGKWTAIAWPDAALSAPFLSSAPALAGLSSAWVSMAAPFTDAAALY
jgi:hypothetical protein